MEYNFKRILSPFYLNEKITLKNRLYFSAMGIDVSHNDGRASAEFTQFYENIIDGGCGMIVLGNASIHSSTRLQQRGLCLHNDEHAEALCPIISYGRKNGCEVVVQLQHYGAQGSSECTNVPLLSPSGLVCSRMKEKEDSYEVRVMTLDDIIEVRYQFVEAAKRAQQAGARVVQLQASNGYLLSSFLSPYTNHRLDEYGGDPFRRMKLLTDVISDIRKALPSLEVSVRLGIDDCLGERGQRPGILAPCLKVLKSLRVAFIECSMSIGETFSWMLNSTSESKKLFHNGIKTIRSATCLPLGFAGFVSDLKDAEQLMYELNVELVGMTRAIFADNELILKSITGRENEIYKCHFDGNCFRDKSNPNLDRVYCCVNPRYQRSSSIIYQG
ncbi:NADPH dehydrogenase [Photorhabdus luminescens]|uniref:oxidoreductase n=1 Tax=Photorhabdus akhurstii TaxID=171438 RepID=UPI000CF973D0|nr:NADPH dehydrogenase [Photorhabdus luminescens]PQQ29834.1 NADPH dehydrogenase [Photorhabdus luminescens]